MGSSSSRASSIRGFLTDEEHAALRLGDVLYIGIPDRGTYGYVVRRVDIPDESQFTGIRVRYQVVRHFRWPWLQTAHKKPYSRDLAIINDRGMQIPMATIKCASDTGIFHNGIIPDGTVLLGRGMSPADRRDG